MGASVTDDRGFSSEGCGRLGLRIGVVAVVGLCAGMAGAAGLTCAPAAGGQAERAGRLCKALAAELETRAVPADGLTLEVVRARADLVVARLHRHGAAGPLVQMVAMDGPLLPDWPEKLAADLLRATPPP